MHGTELPFDVLKPLIAETAAKAVDSGDPHRVQTGPAVRGDLRRCGGTKPHSLTIRDCYEFMNH